MPPTLERLCNVVEALTETTQRLEDGLRLMGKDVKTVKRDVGYMADKQDVLRQMLYEQKQGVATMLSTFYGQQAYWPQG